jgi:hypothetical protein
MSRISGPTLGAVFAMPSLKKKPNGMARTNPGWKLNYSAIDVTKNCAQHRFKSDRGNRYSLLALTVAEWVRYAQKLS